MKASSSDARWVVSSNTGSRACQAARPICSAVSPRTCRTSDASLVTVMSGPSSRVRSSATSGSPHGTLMPPARDTNSSTVVSAISRPRPITTSRVAVSAISLIRCEETNTVWPSAARALSRFRTQSTPSGSSPLTGLSRITTRGSPSRAEAMPSRWPIPSENPPTRLAATSARPTISISSPTRRRGTPFVCASASRWLRADRPVCTALASSRMPSSAIGAAAAR